MAKDWLVSPWLIWLSSFYRYLFTGAISLDTCLRVFFSADHLRDDDMYSCEKCEKLRNGMKQCVITKLPEVLCIHLKRFRHENAYNSKISTRVTFPICDLDLAPFVNGNEQSATFDFPSSSSETATCSAAGQDTQ